MKNQSDIKYLKEIIAEIKSKKELSSLDDSFVSQKVLEFIDYPSHIEQKKIVLNKLENSKSYKQFSKSREHDFLFKSLRSELRKIYGVFIKEDNNKKHSLLLELEGLVKERLIEEQLIKEKPPDSEDSEHASDSILKSKLRELLKLHQSTNERMPYYEDVYYQIFETIEKHFANSDGGVSSKKSAADIVKKYSILDLGCGLNPTSSILIKDKIAAYIASDISKDDVAFISDFFKKMKINGTAIVLDIVKELETDLGKKRLSELSDVDICFMFKLLDTLEREKLDITPHLLSCIKSKFIIISFPTESLSGKKKISQKRRVWFDDLLKSSKYNYVEHIIGGEMFYMIKNY